MSVDILRCTRTQYSVREWTPVMVSRVAPCRPAFWKWEKNVQALKFPARPSPCPKPLPDPCPCLFSGMNLDTNSCLNSCPSLVIIWVIRGHFNLINDNLRCIFKQANNILELTFNEMSPQSYWLRFLISRMTFWWILTVVISSYALLQNDNFFKIWIRVKGWSQNTFNI